MTTFPKHQRELEHHCIDRTLAHIRIATPLQLSKLISSIDASGQLVPVIVVPSEGANRFTLVDGYLRVAALHKLRQDIVKAEIWECSEADALLSLLASHGQRKWEAFEEAQALRELQTRYQLSQERIAQRIGRTHSWISRRLALLDILSDQFIQAITQGAISVWTAYRVLAPVARATPQHAETLLAYLRENSI
jgi:ParB family transcriptional regulator, chromosome partitioning protein